MVQRTSPHGAAGTATEAGRHALSGDVLGITYVLDIPLNWMRASAKGHSQVFLLSED
jgi:hypothetical protein